MAVKFKAELILESIKDAFFALDNRGCFSYVNENAELILNYSRKELLGKNLWDLFPRARQNKLFRECQKVIKSELPSEYSEFNTLVEKWLDIRIFPCNGGVSVYFRDITEAKGNEEALKLAYERNLFLASILESSSQPFALICPESGQIKDCNKAFCSLTGYTREEILNQVFWFGNLTPTEWYECDSQIINEVLTTGEPKRYEREYLHKDGHCIPVELFIQQSINENKYIHAFVSDITERKKIEKELEVRKNEREMARLERLNLIGRIAGGLCHEMKNPLTTIRGFLQFLGVRSDCASEEKKYYQIIIGELDRVNQIIEELLNMSKDKIVELKLQNLNNIIEKIYPLISGSALIKNKEVYLQLGQVPDLNLDDKEICQLILNLAQNGLEAMPAGGKLYIKTYTDQEKVILEVQDAGSGIRPEIIDKLGTPFVTTKEKGTGLGLAVCYGIAERNNAKIDYLTGPQGTTFFVKFENVIKTNDKRIIEINQNASPIGLVLNNQYAVEVVGQGQFQLCLLQEEFKEEIKENDQDQAIPQGSEVEVG